MADEIVTAADVLAAAGTKVTLVKAGEAITPGQSVYLDTSNDRWKKAIATGTALQAGGSGVAIAVSEALLDGAPLVIVQGGNLDPGFTPVVGMLYYVGNDGAGGIMAQGDLLSTDKVTQLGIGTSATNLRMKPWATGESKA